MRYRAILYRKDPPFTETVYATLLLEHARGHALLLNDPRGLRDANEKLFALRFPALTPPTAVLRRLQAIHDFCRAHSGACVFKPLDGCGGSGIFVLRTGDPNANVIVESATGDGSRAVIAQAWLPRSADGDKRIFLLDGEPIGALLRVPAAGEFRSNLHRGGIPQGDQPHPPRTRDRADRRRSLHDARPRLRGHRRHRRAPDRGERELPDRLP